MEAIDTSNVNPQSTIGQITILIVALVSLVTAIRPLLKNPKAVMSSHRVNLLSDELKAAKRDVEFTRRINRNLAEWQLSARELIRLLRNALSEAGIPIPERAQSLTTFLEKVESEDLYRELEINDES